MAKEPKQPEQKPKTQSPKPGDSSGRVYYENILRKGGFCIKAEVLGVLSQTANCYGVIFIAPRPCEIMWASECHSVKGSDAGAVGLNMQILDPGVVKGSGDNVLVTAWNLKAVEDTPQNKEGFDFTSNRVLATGQRLGLRQTGTLTDLTGVHVTVYLKWWGKGDFM